MEDARACRGKIVVVEDEESYREVLAETLLANGYEVRTAADGASGLVLIRRWMPDAVVLDWVLPVMDGGALTRTLKADPSFRRIFVIIASARGEGQMRAEGIESGADDYLVKPIEAKELLARLRNGLVMRRLQMELEEKNRELELLTVTDPLTGLPNRRAFDKGLERELRRAERFKDPFGLAILDVDKFKAINDTFGHEVGDEVLKEIGRRLRDVCPAGDEVARIGGEEFGLILPRSVTEEMLTVTEQMRAAVSDTPFRTSEGELGVTVSAGAACSGGEIGYDEHELFKAADEALYRSKTEGRNRVTLSTRKSSRKTRQADAPIA
jgi:two-component system cell cycle response regulator